MLREGVLSLHRAQLRLVIPCILPCQCHAVGVAAQVSYAPVICQSSASLASN